MVWITTPFSDIEVGTQSPTSIRNSVPGPHPPLVNVVHRHCYRHWEKRRQGWFKTHDMIKKMIFAYAQWSPDTLRSVSDLGWELGNLFENASSSVSHKPDALEALGFELCFRFEDFNDFNPQILVAKSGSTMFYSSRATRGPFPLPHFER